jgi:hypothetical protein
MTTTQLRNDQNIDLLSADFVTRNEFYQNGARLQNSVNTLLRDGGGRQRWGWLATSPQLFGAAAPTTLTETNIDDTNYKATSNGAPCVDFNGSNEILNAGVVNWSKPTSNTFLNWVWVNIDATTGAQQYIYGTWVGGNYEWLLVYNQGTGKFRAQVRSGVPSTILIDSTHAFSFDTWYFVGMYYQPSTLLRIYVGDTSDTSLTITSNTTSIPASITSTGGAFTIGGSSALGNLLNGFISISSGWCNVPATNIDEYATRIFHETRWFYQ